MTMTYRSRSDDQLAAHFDPEPWTRGKKGARNAEKARGRVFAPRVEYVPADALKASPNALLVSFRIGETVTYKRGLGMRAGIMANRLERGIHSSAVSPEEVAFAIKVLNRLAAIS